jgi:hypothetical protein
VIVPDMRSLRTRTNFDVSDLATVEGWINMLLRVFDVMTPEDDTTAFHDWVDRLVQEGRVKRHYLQN